jgi:hypothetical protein
VFELRALHLLGRQSTTGVMPPALFALVLLLLLLLIAVLGLELRAFTLSHSASHVVGFFEIGSHELISRANFEP